MQRYARLAALVWLGLLTGLSGHAEEGAAPSGVVPTEPTPVIPEAIQALFAHRQPTTSVQGRFTCDTADASAGAGEHRLGDFAVLRQEGAPSYHLKMAKADGSNLERWCSNGRRSWHIEQADPQWPVDVREQPAGADGDMRRIVDCILLELPSLAKEFTFSLDSAAVGSVVVLTPRTQELRQDLAAIRVRVDAGGEPTDLVIDDGRGGTMAVKLSEIVRNKPIAPALFVAQ